MALHVHEITKPNDMPSYTVKPAINGHGNLLCGLKEDINFLLPVAFYGIKIGPF